MSAQVDFEAIKADALDRFDDVMGQWLPGGHYEGAEYLAINPTRDDADFGSFKVNSQTGRWADFALDDDAKGGDLVSLIAYLDGGSQADAARRLQEFLRETAEASPPATVAVVEQSATQEKQQWGGDRTRALAVAKSGSASPADTRAHSKRATRRRHPDTDLEWVHPVPEGAPPVLQKHSRYGEPSMHWTYRNNAGGVMSYVCRFDRPGGSKEVLPLTLWRDSAGTLTWKFKGMPALRPLYGLDRLAARPDAPVVITEGEKAADAAATLFPNHVAVTTPGGAKAIAKCNLSPLVGRVVYIWPDNDDPGRRYAVDLAERLLKLDRQASIYILKQIGCLPETDEIGQPELRDGFEPPKGWDAADAMNMGWTAGHVALLPHEQWVDVQEENGIGEGDAGLPPGYLLREDGLLFREEKSDGRGKPKVVEVWLSTPIRVVGKSRDEAGQNWGTYIEFSDPDGSLKQWCFADELLQQPGQPHRMTLASLGAKLSNVRKAVRCLDEYFLQSDPSDRFLSVTKSGWHGDDVFVLPGRLYGGADKQVVFQTDDPERDGIYGVSGTLREWQEQVAKECIGNMRPMFVISAALAGPLLRLRGMDGGGFHFRGPSSLGKSIMLQIGSSVWGGERFVASWRATDNGLEGTAVLRNDTLLVLDELGGIDPRVLGQTAYMLANGVGKVRASRDGRSRMPARWRTLFISSGEVSLSTHLQSAGRQPRAGQELRLLDIPADAGTGLGVFDTIPAGTSSALFAEMLRERAKRYCGSAGRAWLEALTDPTQRDRVLATVERVMEEFRSACTSPSDAGQVQRALARFALVAAAGEAAIEAGILPWESGQAVAAARACFAAWLRERDDRGESERHQIIAQVRHFIEEHGESRFDDLDHLHGVLLPNRVVPHRAGYIRRNGDYDSEYLVLPEVFRSEVCSGFPHRYVCQVLDEAGYLRRGSDGFTRSERIRQLSRSKRVYVLTAELMRDGNLDWGGAQEPVPSEGWC